MTTDPYPLVDNELEELSYEQTARFLEYVARQLRRQAQYHQTDTVYEYDLTVQVDEHKSECDD